jgi:Na+/glutamate symporter
MDSKQNIMPEQADVLYSSSSDTSEEQEEEEEPDVKTANVSDAPLWLTLVVGAMYTAFAIPLGTAIVKEAWHLTLPTWVIGLIIGILYAAWIALIVFLNRRWRQIRAEPKGR